MKRILLIIAMMLAIPTFAQWTIEPDTPFISYSNNDEAIEGDGIDFEYFDAEVKEYRTVTVVIARKVMLGADEWEGYGYDRDGNWYYLYHKRGEKTIGKLLPRKPDFL